MTSQSVILDLGMQFVDAVSNGEMIAVARQKSGVRKLEGHDIMALERFAPEVTHMIVFDVLSRESHP